MSSPSQVFVLAEDQRQRQFIYRFLVHAGIDRRRVTIEVSPSGLGSGEQWVRKNFARQASKCRARNARNARASTGMIVLLDADRLSVQEHLNELNAALIAADQPRYDPAQDTIARLIPKWSIETWILYLSSDGKPKPPVSEDEPYKRSRTEEQWAELIPQASRTFHAWSKAAVERPVNLLDSLRRGLDEIPRAVPVAR
jgi:hypothetical protein